MTAPAYKVTVRNPKLAGRDVVIDRSKGKIYVDGVEFPWFIEAGGPTVECTESPTATRVRIPVVVYANNVQIIPMPSEEKVAQ